MWLSTTQGTETRARLEELSMGLMDEARSLEREFSISPTPTK